MHVQRKMPRGMILYFLLIVFVSIGNGFSDAIFSNYFKDAYQVTSFQRGLLEIPRELPGMICAVVIALLTARGDLVASLIAQVLAFIGLSALALSTPSFNLMMVFLFINSLGMHMFFPLQDAIGMDLAEPENVGRRMGQYASARSVVGFVTATTVFFGVRAGVFSFVTPVKGVFVLGALGFLGAIAWAALLVRSMKGHEKAAPPRGSKLLFRRQYKYYYYLAVLQGVQKQITYVYGSWVLIDILRKGTDVMSLLFIASNFACIFFMQLLGRWIDRFGIKRMMYANAIGLIFVYVIYGVVVLSLARNWMPENLFSVGMLYLLFMLDRVSMQISVVRAIYLRSIAWDGNDVSPTLSTGTSLDHLVTIVAAPLCGLVWANWGPHWVFFIAALFSLGNLYVAWKIHPEQEAERAEQARAALGA